jgi:hypothetical protein
VLVMGLGLWWWSQRGEPTIDETGIGKPSIAVLPFDNLGGDGAPGGRSDRGHHHGSVPLP